MASLWARALGDECGRRNGCCRLTLAGLAAGLCAGLPLVSVGLGLADWDLCPEEPWLPLFSVVGGVVLLGLHLLCVLCGVACGKCGWVTGWVVWACGVAANWSVCLGVFRLGPRKQGWDDLMGGNFSQRPKVELDCSERLAKFHVFVSLGLWGVPTAALAITTVVLLFAWIYGSLAWINDWDGVRSAPRR